MLPVVKITTIWGKAPFYFIKNKSVNASEEYV